jgi:hypothetical protein
MNLSEIIRRAIEIGGPSGIVTFNQLNELIDEQRTKPEDIERLFQALSDEGIDVVEA